jgi:histidine triad (HIT) family protein
VSEDGCVFCLVLSGDIPSERVQEDEHTLAVMDINPFTRGHAVVFPKRHVRGLYDVDEEELARTFSAARRLALAVRDRLGATGVNLLNNNERAAWQSIFHFHVHVIPRYDGDPMRLPVEPRPADPQTLQAVAQELRGN